jgi:hypothetical protein
MAIAKHKWQEAQTLFELGNSLSYISNKTDIDRSSISKKAKQEGWQQGRIQHLQDEKVVAVSNLIDIEKKINSEIQPHEKEILNNEVLEITKLKIAAKNVQAQMLTMLRKATEQVNRILENSPDGLYTKGESAQGTQYGRTTEFVKDLVSAMPSTNTILGLDKSLVEVNNNTQNNNDEQITFNINPVRIADDSKS